jgi:type I restriction enzyme M protein
METRVLKIFTDDDISKIADTVHVWKTGDGYQDIAGFCKSTKLGEIEENGFVLTPGRYVGTEEIEEDNLDINLKISALISEYENLENQNDILRSQILKALRNLFDAK